MGWWGGGKSEDTGPEPEKTDMALGSEAFTSGHGDNFGSAPGVGGQSRAPAEGAGVSQAQLQRMVMQEQRGPGVGPQIPGERYRPRSPPA